MLSAQYSFTLHLNQYFLQIQKDSYYLGIIRWNHNKLIVNFHFILNAITFHGMAPFVYMSNEYVPNCTIILQLQALHNISIEQLAQFTNFIYIRHETLLAQICGIIWHGNNYIHLLYIGKLTYTFLNTFNVKFSGKIKIYIF